jgi:6-pyruvoyltetrahydropterin/6-carboxytetrahydropterin synthase
MRLGIVEYMDCAHHLPGHPRCGRQHGHTYKVELILEGTPKDGMVLDFAEMKRALRETLAEYDHRDMNDFMDYPSVENICMALKKRLEARVKFPFLLRVWEGEGKWAEG